MKKQIFFYFGIWLFFVSTVSFSMEEKAPFFSREELRMRNSIDEQFLLTAFSLTREEATACKIDPIIDECEREEALKIIHANSMCASPVAKGVIEAILKGQSRKYPGILFHGPYGTGKTLMAKEIVGMMGGGMFLWADLLEKNEGYLQRFIEKYIEDPIRRGERCVYVLDEVDRIVCYDTQFNTGISPKKRILNCLKLACEANKREGGQDVCVIATTNYPGRIPRSIRNLLLGVEIKNPDFDRRIIYFNELIDSLASHNADVSGCDEGAVHRIAEKSKNFAVRELERVSEDVSCCVFSQDGDRKYLEEEHFEKAMEDIRPHTLFVNSKDNPWSKKISNWFQNVRFRLVENDAAYFVKSLFARAFASFAMKRIIDCCRSLPRPSSVFFLSGRNNSRLQIQDVPHRQVHGRYTLLGPPLRVMTSQDGCRGDRRLIESPVRRNTFDSDDFTRNALLCFDYP